MTTTEVLRWSCSKCTSNIVGNGNDDLLNKMIKEHKCTNLKK